MVSPIHSFVEKCNIRTNMRMFELRVYSLQTMYVIAVYFFDLIRNGIRVEKVLPADNCKCQFWLCAKSLGVMFLQISATGAMNVA